MYIHIMKIILLDRLTYGRTGSGYTRLNVRGAKEEEQIWAVIGNIFVTTDKGDDLDEVSTM